jgi:hypothetical protein
MVWFDPGIGYLLPGEVSDFSRAAQVVTVEAVINGKVIYYLIKLRFYILQSLICFII